MIKEKFLNLIRKYSKNEDYNLECWNEIENNYSSKSRHYHNLDHLENMLSELSKIQSEVKDLDCLLFAIYYHDIIYKSTKSNNEHQSALTFENRIVKTSFEKLNECMSQIEATKEHKISDDYDTNLLLDLDLSVLGKTSEEYKKYSESIRKEYQIYPDFMYRKGRKKVLKSILELDFIYKTDYFKRMYENQAKENLRLELKQLS
jgi:predicted metal-dependent HD superfamily phosphohydrolase